MISKVIHLVDNWMARGRCTDDTLDLWFSDEPQLKRLAQHNCLFHCPVLIECQKYTDDEIKQGRYPKGIVQAGRIYLDGEFGERSVKIKGWCTDCDKELAKNAGVSSKV